MARLLKTSIKQPSALSKLELCSVQLGLQQYSSAVHRTISEESQISDCSSQLSNARHIWEDTASEILSVRSYRGSLQAPLRDETCARRSYSTASITSDDLKVDDSIWSDAPEYQLTSKDRSPHPKSSSSSRKLQESPGSQSAISENAEIRDTGKLPCHVMKTVRTDPTTGSTPVALPERDIFARITRQYDDIPEPRRHRPLAKETFFSLSNNPTSNGRPPAVIYVTNERQLDSVITLLKRPIISLDMEWISWTTKKNISLIQLADAHTVLLVQISQFKEFPSKLKQLIEDPTWIKCGVAIMNADASRLRDVYGVLAQGVCELSYFARLVNRHTHGAKNTLIKLSDLAYTYLGAHLSKGDVRCGNWNAVPLSREQRHYAAIDAYAGYLIFAELERRRQSDIEFYNVWPCIRACPAPQVSATAANHSPESRTNLRQETKTEIPCKARPSKSTLQELTNNITKDMIEPCDTASSVGTHDFVPAATKAKRRPRKYSKVATENRGKTSRHF